MKKNNILTIVLIIIIFALSSFIVYDKVLSNNGDNVIDNNDKNMEHSSTNNDDEDLENTKDNYKNYTEDCSNDDIKCSISYTFETNKNYKSVVEVQDTFAITNEPMYGKRFFILHNGNLYYDIEKCNDGYCNYMNYRLNDNYSEYLSELNKFIEISDIKRIKSYNPSNGADWSLFLITNSGDVYDLYYNQTDGKFLTKKVEKFAKYKVDDIVEYNISLPYGDEFKIILKDGTTLTKTINTNNK